MRILNHPILLQDFLPLIRRSLSYPRHNLKSPFFFPNRRKSSKAKRMARLSYNNIFLDTYLPGIGIYICMRKIWSENRQLVNSGFDAERSRNYRFWFSDSIQWSHVNFVVGQGRANIAIMTMRYVSLLPQRSCEISTALSWPTSDYFNEFWYLFKS